jgi:hypothetical protein
MLDVIVILITSWDDYLDPCVSQAIYNIRGSYCIRHTTTRFLSVGMSDTKRLLMYKYINLKYFIISHAVSAPEFLLFCFKFRFTASSVYFAKRSSIQRRLYYVI